MQSIVICQKNIVCYYSTVHKVCVQYYRLILCTCMPCSFAINNDTKIYFNLYTNQKYMD